MSGSVPDVEVPFMAGGAMLGRAEQAFSLALAQTAQAGQMAAQAGVQTAAQATAQATNQAAAAPGMAVPVQTVNPLLALVLQQAAGAPSRFSSASPGMVARSGASASSALRRTGTPAPAMPQGQTQDGLEAYAPLPEFNGKASFSPADEEAPATAEPQAPNTLAPNAAPPHFAGHPHTDLPLANAASSRTGLAMRINAAQTLVASKPDVQTGPAVLPDKAGQQAAAAEPAPVLEPGAVLHRTHEAVPALPAQPIDRSGKAVPAIPGLGRPPGPAKIMPSVSASSDIVTPRLNQPAAPPASVTLPPQVPEALAALPGPFGPLLRAGVAPATALDLQIQWEDVWQGKPTLASGLAPGLAPGPAVVSSGTPPATAQTSLQAHDPLWARWGFAGPGDMVKIFSRLAFETNGLHDALTIGFRPSAMIRTALPEMAPVRSPFLTAVMTERNLLGLTPVGLAPSETGRSEGQAGLGIGGVSRILPDQAPPEGMRSLIALVRAQGNTVLLAVEPVGAGPAPPVPPQNDAQPCFTAPYFTAVVHQAGNQTGSTAMIRLNWNDSAAALLNGRHGTAFLRALGAAVEGISAVMPPARLTLKIPLGRPHQQAPRPPGSAPVQAGLAQTRSAHAGHTGWAHGANLAAAATDQFLTLHIPLRHENAAQPEADASDARVAALGSFVTHTVSRRLRVDLGDSCPGAPPRRLWQQDRLTTLVAVGVAGLDAAVARAAMLPDMLAKAPDPLLVLQPGEGVRNWHGSPLWLRLLAIDKPVEAGVIPHGADPPRFEIVHERDGGWLVGHHVFAPDLRWYARYPDAASESAAFRLDVCYGLPAESGSHEADMQHFTAARAEAEYARARMSGLPAARHAEAWSGIAVEWALHIARRILARQAQAGAAQAGVPAAPAPPGQDAPDDDLAASSPIALWRRFAADPAQTPLGAILTGAVIETITRAVPQFAEMTRNSEMPLHQAPNHERHLLRLLEAPANAGAALRHCGDRILQGLTQSMLPLARHEALCVTVAARFLTRGANE